MTKTQDIRWKAELEIIRELGEIPPCRKMAKLLKEKYALDVSIGTINDDLKKDLEALTEEEYVNQKNKLLDMTMTEIDTAHDIVKTATDSKLKLKAMEVGTKLKKSQAELLSIFRKTQAQLNVEDKPIYKVYIGSPEETEVNQNVEKAKKDFKDVKDKENVDETDTSK